MASCSGLCCAAYSHVGLRDGEPKRIADYLELTEEKFRQRYVFLYPKEWKWFDEKIHQVVSEGFIINPCPFWTTGLCGIQEVKPLVCKKFRPACVADSWLERSWCISRMKDFIKDVGGVQSSKAIELWREKYKK